jgi:hypothetical protein
VYSTPSLAPYSNTRKIFLNKTFPEPMFIMPQYSSVFAGLAKNFTVLAAWLLPGPAAAPQVKGSPLQRLMGIR